MVRYLPVETGLLLGREEALAEIEQTAMGMWALEITLLLEGLAESLLVKSSTGSSVVFSLRREQGHAEKRTLVTQVGENKIKIELSRTQADYMQAFLLRAYRDGMAEVNHIHIEGNLGGSPYDLTLFFNASRSPMSSEEALKFLGD